MENRELSSRHGMPLINPLLQLVTSLLRSFIGVKGLHMSNSLSEELSRVLQVDEIGSDPGPGIPTAGSTRTRRHVE